MIYWFYSANAAKWVVICRTHKGDIRTEYDTRDEALQAVDFYKWALGRRRVGVVEL